MYIEFPVASDVGTQYGTTTGALLNRAAVQPRGLIFSQTLTPSSVSTNTSVEQNFTVTGLIAGSFVIVNGPAQTAGIVMGSARVSSANTLTINFSNPTAGSLTPASGTYNIVMFES
jgi:hypothetical protein